MCMGKTVAQNDQKQFYLLRWQTQIDTSLAGNFAGNAKFSCEEFTVYSIPEF